MSSDEARKEHPRSGRNSPAEDFGAPCACRSAGRRVKRASLVIRSRKKAVRKTGCFFVCRRNVFRRGSKGAPARRRKDRCAPSRAAARDIRPLVLLLRSSKSLARLGCSLINAFTTPHCRYQLFAVSRGKVLCIHFPSCRERTPRRSKDRCAPSRVVTRDIRSLVLLLLSSKSLARLGCSLINALATRRLATNFFRYRAVRLISFLQTAVAANAFRYRAVRLIC